MRDLFFKKLNNQGAAFVTVIVCMLFAGIIAATILTIAVTNLTYATQQTKAAQSSYSAEQALDEVRTTMAAYADVAYRNAMEECLQTYTTNYTTEDDNTRFSPYFITEYLKVLSNEGIITGSLTSYAVNPAGVPVTVADAVNDLKTYPDATVKCSYSANALSQLISTSSYAAAGASVEFDPATVSSGMVFTMNDEGKLVINNIALVFTDKLGNISYISTDLVMNVNFPTSMLNAQGAALPAATEGVNTEMFNYSIIADGGITFKDLNTCDVKGDLYSGGDIIVQNIVNSANRNDGFNFDGDRLVAKGSFKIGDGSLAWLGANRSSAGDIWATDFVIFKDSKSTRTDVFLNDNLNLSGSLQMNGGDDSTLTVIGSDVGMYFYESGTDPAISMGEKQYLSAYSLESESNLYKQLVLYLTGLTEAGVSGTEFKSLNELWINQRPAVAIGGKTTESADLDLQKISDKCDVSLTWDDFLTGFRDERELGQWGNSRLLLRADKLSTGSLKVSEANDNSVASNGGTPDSTLVQEKRTTYSGLKNGLNGNYGSTNASATSSVVNLLSDASFSQLIDIIRYETGNGSYNATNKTDYNFSSDTDSNVTINGQNFTVFSGNTTLKSTWNTKVLGVTIWKNVETIDRNIIANGNVTIENYVTNAGGYYFGDVKGIIVAKGDVNITCSDFNGIIIATGNVTINLQDGINGLNSTRKVSGSIISGGMVTIGGTEENDVIIELGSVSNYKNIIESNSLFSRLFTVSLDAGAVPGGSVAAGDGFAAGSTNYDYISVDFDDWKKY